MRRLCGGGARLRAGGFSIDLTHHAMHAMGSRLLGFTQELFDDSAGDATEPRAVTPPPAAERYPHITGMVMAITHDQDSVVGGAATTSSSSSSPWT